MDRFHNGILWDNGAGAAQALTTSFVPGVWFKTGNDALILLGVTFGGTVPTSIELQVEYTLDNGTTIYPFDAKVYDSGGVYDVDDEVFRLNSTSNGEHSVRLSLPPWMQCRVNFKRTGGDPTSNCIAEGRARPFGRSGVGAGYGGGGGGGGVGVDPHIIYVRKGYSLASRDGSLTAPYDEIQDAVDFIETQSPSGANPYLIDVGPERYYTPVVIHQPGISIRGAIGKYGATIIWPTTGVAFTLTNATPASLVTYRGSGIYSDLVNQGDAGPQDAQYDNLYFLSNDANAFEALGVQGDAVANTTNFCYGSMTFGVTLENCSTWSATGDGYYVRNARGLSHKRCNDAVSAGNGLQAINCTVSGLSFSVFGSNVVSTYDSTDPNGRAHGSQTGLYIRLSDVHGAVDISAEGKSYINQSRVRGYSASGTGAHKLYHSHVELDMDLDDTVDVEFFNGFIEGELTAEAGVTFQFSDVRTEGDVTMAAGAGACTWHGGSIIGILTDPSSRLTYTDSSITAHAANHGDGGIDELAFTDLAETPSTFAGSANEFARVNATPDALTFFDLFGSANTWTAAQTHSADIRMNSADIIPTVDTADNVGTAAARFQRVRARQLLGVGGNLAPTLGAQGNYGIVAGRNQQGTGSTNTFQFGAGNYPPFALIGNCYTAGTGRTARLDCKGGGSMLFGSAFARAGTAQAIIDVASGAYGSFTGGYSYPGGITTTAVAKVENQASGSFVWAYTNPLGSGTAFGGTTSGGRGAFVSGKIVCSTTFNATMQAESTGSFVQGYIWANSANASIKAQTTSSRGSFVQGCARNPGGLGVADLISTRAGSFVQGYAKGGYILSSGFGGFAHGYATGGYSISAAGRGAFAAGDATAGSIVASGVNSFQWGVGTNALADSLQVGSAGLRMKGTTGAPGTPQNGDIWVSNNYVYIRSNGVSCKCTNATM